MLNNTLILGLNPAWQRLFITEKFELGEVHRLPKAVEFGSGKGINCGRVLQLLGGNPVMMHFLGGSHGSCIFDELSNAGIQQVPIWIQTPTRICTTVVSDGVTTELIEPSPVLSDLENEDFIQTLSENWEDVNKIELHDWFIYAFARENNYKWHIDEKPSMRYRQHTSNQVGANDGLKAKLKRLKKVLSSWYREEIIKIIKVLRLENKYKFSKYILNKSYLNNLLLLKYSFEFRRNKKEKLFLSLLILLGIF